MECKAITQWPLKERPREKMLFQGEESLTDTELIAILLNSGDASKSKTAVDLARDLLKKFKTLEEISKASLNELTQIQGIGLAKASKIKAGFELSRRIEKQEIQLKNSIYCAEDAFKYFKRELSALKQEKIAILFLDARNKIISETQMKGAFSQASINVRELTEQAFKTGASAIILCHNHPSGNEQPTEADLKSTKELQKILEKMQIILADHIIIGRKKYYSFNENSKI